MKKKIIVPAILFLLLAGILLIRLGTHPQSSPDPVSAPSALTGTAASAIPYTTDKSKPVKARKDPNLRLPDKEPVIWAADDHLYILQTDGTIDTSYHDFNELTGPEKYRTKKWLYYTREEAGTYKKIICRAPIRQRGNKIQVLLKKEKELKKLPDGEWVNRIIYATDKYVIYATEDDMIKYTIQSKKEKYIEPSQDDAYDITWLPARDLNGDSIIGAKGELYMTKTIYDDDYEDEDEDQSSTFFYKIDPATFQATQLSDRTNSILSDPSGQIVIMESDEKWNYAYYPETGKRYRCGPNMFSEWGQDEELNTFDYDNEDELILHLPAAANRDLVGWIRQNNPWSYQERDGSFECLNFFIFGGRMYVRVNFHWYDPQDREDEDEDEDDEDDGYGGVDANMLFSYSLKNYKGIRPETELNRIMQKYSVRNFESVEDTMYYSYTETGDFSLLFRDTLVFSYDSFYVLYNLRTGSYRKCSESKQDFLYLDEMLGEDEY